MHNFELFPVYVTVSNPCVLPGQKIEKEPRVSWFPEIIPGGVLVL